MAESKQNRRPVALDAGKSKMTKEQLIEKQKAELAKFDKAEAIKNELPEEIRASARITIHGDHVTVTAWESFRTSKKLNDAVRLIREVENQVVEGEHWKSGCVSTRPASINDYAKNERATMDGSHAVEVVVEGGKGFGPQAELRFWVQLTSGLAEIHAPVCDLGKLYPRVEATYNNRGELANCRIDWPTESRCTDSFRNWWSEKPSFRGSYYLADLPNFYSWVSSVQKA